MRNQGKELEQAKKLLERECHERDQGGANHETAGIGCNEIIFVLKERVKGSKTVSNLCPLFQWPGSGH